MTRKSSGYCCPTGLIDHFGCLGCSIFDYAARPQSMFFENCIKMRSNRPWLETLRVFPTATYYTTQHRDGREICLSAALVPRKKHQFPFTPTAPLSLETLYIRACLGYIYIHFWCITLWYSSAWRFRRKRERERKRKETYFCSVGHHIFSAVDDRSGMLTSNGRRSLPHHLSNNSGSGRCVRLWWCAAYNLYVVIRHNIQPAAAAAAAREKKLLTLHKLKCPCSAHFSCVLWALL